MSIKGFKPPFATDPYIALAIAETFSNSVSTLKTSSPGNFVSTTSEYGKAPGAAGTFFVGGRYARLRYRKDFSSSNQQRYPMKAP